MSVDRFQGNYKKFLIKNVDNIYWKNGKENRETCFFIITHPFTLFYLTLYFNPIYIKYIEGNMHKQPPTI